MRDLMGRGSRRIGGVRVAAALASHDHGDFVARGVETDFVHEVGHEHQSAPRSLVDRVGIAWIGDRPNIEPGAFVSNDELGFVESNVGVHVGRT